ncbi:MAG: type IV secretion system DotC family protein [Gammaproteobacteria bacterium]|nr:type IV secretion system DotC family protein [Gammaproteobacteria bacterium]
MQRLRTIESIISRSLLLLLCLTIGLLSGCSSSVSKESIDTANLSDLQNLNQKDTSAIQPKIGKIRLDALKEVAMTLGAQGGLYKRATQIDSLLEMNGPMLAQVFNFNGMLLDHAVLPPVLTESISSLHLAAPDVIRASDRTYKIVKQARFVTAAPTWRDYLWMDFKKPEIPDATLLPRDSKEREVWIEYVNIGWKNGLNQADNIYATNLATLQRDFKGMMIYEELLAQNMVSKPFVATANMGVTSNDSRTEMQINVRILRITATPQLNANSKEWRPAMVQNND